jgi:hypothetical protein
MLEGLIFILLAILTLSFAPYAGSMEVPTAVRIVVILILLGVFLSITIRKKRIAYFLLIYFPVSALLVILWYRNSPQSLPPIMYVLAFVLLAVLLMNVIGRYPLLAWFLSKFLLILAVGTALLAILSFVAFNFDLLPYQSIKLGEFDYYNFYYNPLLGYISPKVYGDMTIGRVAGYMFEPSYMGWYMTTSFFLVDKFFSRKTMTLYLCRVIVFLGVIATFSTGAFVVMAVVFIVKIGYGIMKKFGFSERTKNIIVGSFFGLGIIAFLLLPKDQITESLGNSSYEDRDQRIESSLLILANSGGVDLLLGHSPAFIENSDIGKGESNQYIKLLVEEGVLITFLVVAWLVYCTKRNRYFMLANLLFLNSVVILWTPLFILSVIYCYWKETAIAKKNSP